VGRDFSTIRKTYAHDCVAIAANENEARRIAQSNKLCDSQSPFTGTPDQVAAQIQKFADLGVDLFIFRFADFPKTEGVRLFAREVLPRFQA
jgi:alkanesulfonate monooxygenase SsuD/methylene tetrahydromethanopterin reductase-like flavin-dependent oxidoreductase (luciferase family)